MKEHYYGSSIPHCVHGIYRMGMDANRVTRIYSDTAILGQAHASALIEKWKKTFWANNPEEEERLFRDLWAANKIVQPGLRARNPWVPVVESPYSYSSLKEMPKKKLTKPLSKKIEGRLMVYTDHGIGSFYAIQKRGTDGLEGLQILNNGDWLEIFGDTGMVIWRGEVSLVNIESEGGHLNSIEVGHQEGVSPNLWLRYFREERRARLTTLRTPSADEEEASFLPPILEPVYDSPEQRKRIEKAVSTAWEATHAK